MKIVIIGILAACLNVGAVLAQDKPAPSANHPSTVTACEDLLQDARDLQADVASMQARVVMLRVNAGVVQDANLRNALQVDAELWQQVIDSNKRRLVRLEAESAECSVGKK